MINALRSWIINICTIVIFITAIEMILPNNKMKKYAKFVLGLILVTVMINPLIRLVDRNFNLSKYTRKAESYFDSEKYSANYEKYKNDNLKNTLDNFKENLQLQCKEELEGEYPNSQFNVVVDVYYDKEKNGIGIQGIDIGVKKKAVKKIVKVNVNAQPVNSNNKKYLNDKESKKIKKSISSKFEIPNSVITVYEV